MPVLLAHIVFAVTLCCDLAATSAFASDTGKSVQSDQGEITDCDRFAGHPSMRGFGPGVEIAKINMLVAIPACEAAIKADPAQARFVLNLGRAKFAAGDEQAAFDLHVRAADMGSSLATELVGLFYHEGRVVPKNDDKAVELYRKGAEAGSPAGMGAVAAAYLYGFGVKRDYAEAFAWAKKASDLGDRDATALLGQMYANGSGVQSNLPEALALARRSTDAGSVYGMIVLGIMYNEGKAMPRSVPLALEWWHRAADQGATNAMARIGWLYFSGRDVPKDDVRALSMFRKAADFGDPIAMQGLAAMYFNGSGVPKDYARALAWNQRSVVYGGDPAPVALMLGTIADYKGISKDGTAAADAALVSLKNHSKALVASLKDRWFIWTEAFRKTFEQKLTADGLYAGRTDGMWSPELQTAIEKLAAD